MIDDLLATDESDDDDSFIIGLWCLTPFLTIIQSVYWWSILRKPPTCCKFDKLYQ